MQNSFLLPYLKKYYGNTTMRTIVDIVYILNEILLAIFLLWVPIQVAYFWLLVHDENATIQFTIDIIVIVLFSLHILLYFDSKFLSILKNPYGDWKKRLITIELIYDFAALILAIVAAVIPKKSLTQRIIQLIFFFKVVKVIQFDIKCMSVVVGTIWYMPYKVFRTLLIVFMAIAYVGSLFYGVAYILFTQETEYKYLLWIVDTGAISECVNQPFIIQLEYAMYWALGTASTAAYGDISAAEPSVVLINILALAFEGFLFGFYLNSMHSIPAETSQKETDLLHKFDSFQQHSSNRKLSKKLYLQILCSLEYSQTKKKSLESIEKLMPKTYLQQIKLNIYSSFLNNLVTKTFLQTQQQKLFAAENVKQTICEIGEDIYNYSTIQDQDLIYIKEGKILDYLKDDLRCKTQYLKENGTFIGVFQFLTGVTIPSRTTCLHYCELFSLNRQKFKQSLKKSESKLSFYERGMKAKLNFEGQILFNEPIHNYVQSLQQEESSNIISFNQQKKSKKVIKIFNEGIRERKKHNRGNIKSAKLKMDDLSKKDKSCQTDFKIDVQVDVVHLWTSKKMHNYQIFYEKSQSKF